MFPPVNTKDAVAVEADVEVSYAAMFPKGDKRFVSRVFGWAVNAFTGHHPDYQPIDAPYHDLEHTLQTALCLVRLLHARYLAGENPQLTQRMFQLGLVASLLHDAGYLKRRGDNEGTGAKYTAIHIQRGVEFAETLLKQNGFSAEDIRTVANLIACSGVEVALDAVPFQSELERVVGLALGTADLVSQMAAPDYVEKLSKLYDEFTEAAQHSPEQANVFGMYSNSQELMRKTPVFWDYAKTRLNKDFGGLYRFLNAPYPTGPNHYLESIESNIARLKRLPDGQ